MLRLYTIDDPEVRTISSEIPVADLESEILQEFFDELIQAMIHYDGIGIASPQVGKTIQAVVIAKEYAGTDEHLVLVNPRLVSFSKKTWIMEEGCLSVPGVTGPVERPLKVRVKSFDRHGELLDIKAKGMLARILQHEIDHLGGILFIDKATHVTRQPKAS